MKTQNIELHINGGRKVNVKAILKNTTTDVVVVRSTYADGCWYDNESLAYSCGFSASKVSHYSAIPANEFRECYIFTRR